MKPEEIREAARLMKDAGKSRLPLPINVVLELLDKAQRYDRLPPITKEVWQS